MMVRCSRSPRSGAIQRQSGQPGVVVLTGASSMTTSPRTRLDAGGAHLGRPKLVQGPEAVRWSSSRATPGNPVLAVVVIDSGAGL